MVPALARGCPALTEHVITPAMLDGAWRRVRANRGGAGGDGVTLDVFAAQRMAEFAALAAGVRNGRYRPGPLRQVPLRRPDGKTRILSIPCVRDRVLQTAALMVLQPLLEPRQSEASHAYRPAHGVADALATVRRAHSAGFVWTAEADIAACFDAIPRRRLIAELAIWIDCEAMLRLLAVWINGFGPGDRGIAQGAPISPLLANLYLHPLDRLLVAADLLPVRYADDCMPRTH